MNKQRRRKLKKLLEKRQDERIRKPCAPPSRRHKSRKDYDRKREKRVILE